MTEIYTMRECDRLYARLCLNDTIVGYVIVDHSTDGISHLVQVYGWTDGKVIDSKLFSSEVAAKAHYDHLVDVLQGVWRCEKAARE